MNLRFLLFITILCYSFPSVAQNYNQVALVRLGSIDSSRTTISQILSDPRILSSDRNCQVIEFAMSITVAGGATFGPFITRGAELSDEQKIKIKELSSMKMKITIDNIRLVCNGDQSQEIWSRPIVLRCNYQ